MLRSLLATAFAFIVLAAPAMAKEETFILDKPHTQILFFVNHMGFSNSSGRFLDYSGSFTFDPDNPTFGQAAVTIPVKSLDMGDPTWTEHTGKMFEGDKYPNMEFKSTGVTVTGENTADLVGDLTLHGVTKPVTLKVTKNGCGPHPMSKKLSCGFDATTTIKRSDFGMKDGIPMVSDDVRIQITTEGAVAGDSASAGQNE
ncbi:MAG TPA: YceI family protein [Alphaproteobacteria bacterium]